MRVFFLVILLALCGCISKPPRDVNNICTVFKQYPRWYYDSKSVESRWLVPIPVQMAVIHQESKFNGSARPPRTKLFWVIPWKRPSNAYGYTQALKSTWQDYRKAQGSFLSSRTNFADGVDFIGWYANQAFKRAGIPRTDPYALYLAYHEGIGGYQRQTYLQKPWLIQVAKKVKARAALYQAQLARCDLS